MTILVLGGTGEGRELAERLVAAGAEVLTSLAGAVRAPKMPPGRVRIGGFGGADGFVRVLEAERITAIVDATHPFAARITERTRDIAAARGLPYLRLQRLPWQPAPEDRWTGVATLAEAAPLIAPGACVFLATGRQSLPEAAALSHARLLLRVIDPASTPFPYPGGAFIIGRPPFTAESERALFEAHGVDVLVAKNAGGALAAPKLAAARALGLPVVMLQRPVVACPVTVETVAAAAGWVLDQGGRHG